MRRRRRVHDVPGGGVHHVVLDPTVLARRGRPAADAIDEAPVDLPDQPFRDRPTAAEPTGDELERVPVVHELAYVLRIRPGRLLAGEKGRGLRQFELRSLDVSRMVRLEHERPRAHLTDPVLGKRCRLQKTPRPLDPRQVGRDSVSDREARLKAHRGTASRTSILPVTAADIRALRSSLRWSMALRTA